MRLSTISLVAVVVLGLAISTRAARAECNCVAVAGDVAAGIQAEVAKADGLFSRGDFSGALAIYANAFAGSRDASLMYAQGVVEMQLGQRAKAKAWFEAYLAAGGTLVYKDRAQAQLGLLGGAPAAVRKTGGAVGGVLGGVGGVAGDVAGDVRGTGGAAVGAGAGATGAVVGGVRGNVEGKAKIGRKAGIVLGVIAVAALGAVLVHAIAAGVKDDVELDAKFDLGLGLAGVSVGISAIYVAGLTAATGAAAGAPCLGATTNNARPMGLAAGFRF
jgi:hypothetical protein